jgi:hypothetical protein
MRAQARAARRSRRRAARPLRRGKEKKLTGGPRLAEKEKKRVLGLGRVERK